MYFLFPISGKFQISNLPLSPAMLSTKSFVLLTIVALSSAFPLVENMQSDLGYNDLTQYGRRFFGNPDYSSAERIPNYVPMTNQNPEELGPYLEGDIVIPLGQTRNALSHIKYHWPDAIVPYLIEGDFSEIFR